MLKIIGYRLFAIVYNLCKPLPIRKKRVFCIMTHEDGEGGNVGIAEKALKELGEGYTFSYIRKKDTLEVKGFRNIPVLFRFFFGKSYQLARAQIILMDNVFLPFAYLRRKKGVKVIQLWHGTGTIKKFGQHVNTGKLKLLEKRANSNITHLIVNSVKTQKLYAETFGISTNRVYPIGLPKTDELLRRIREEQRTGFCADKEAIYRKYSISKDKKLVLYAPTFRDKELHNPEVLNKLAELGKGLAKEYCLGIKLHPFIAKAEGHALPQGVCQMSFEEDLTGLLMASDVLITDYSSIIFEYCLTGRPMVFYAYDLEEFSDRGRGFYYDYKSYVPGPVVLTAEETAAVIREKQFEPEKREAFIRSNFTHMDGNACKRLLELIREKE